MQPLFLGVDLGGTKTEAAILDEAGTVLARHRLPSQGDYAQRLQVIGATITAVEQALGLDRRLPLGIGIPGSENPRTGLIRNANSTILNGRPLARDLEQVLGRPVRMRNDADCLALSEARDGAGAGADCVLAMILGTGAGSGIAVEGKVLRGANRIAGEWGHVPLPWMQPEDAPSRPCWCGKLDCCETWLSGPGLAREDAQGRTAEALAEAEAAGDPGAAAIFARHAGRLARAMAVLVNLLDPDVIVIGGGLSKRGALIEALPGLIAPWVFADAAEVVVRPALHGDSSGVRGAAWLWA